MASPFSNIGGHLGYDEEVVNCDEWAGTISSTMTVQTSVQNTRTSQNMAGPSFHNSMAGFGPLPADTAYQYPSPPARNAVVDWPYAQHLTPVIGNVPPTYAAVLQGAAQDPPSIPPPTRVGAPVQSHPLVPMPAAPSADPDARWANYQKYLVGRGNRSPTYAQVVRGAPQGRPLCNEQSIATDDASLAFLGPYADGGVVPSAYTDPQDPMYIDDMYDIPNWQPGMAEPGSNFSGWITVSRAAGDRIRPRGDTSFSSRINGAAFNPSFTTTSASSVSRTSNPRRNRSQMAAGEHEYRCRTCSAGFDTNTELSHHIRYHRSQDQRPYRCGVCGNRFNFPKDLRKHEAVHDQNAPRHLCPYTGCGYATKGFKRRDHLDRHLQTRHRVDSVMQSSGPPSQYG